MTSDIPTELSANPTEIIPVDQMAFAWWNTSLSPVGKDRADDDHKEIAGKIVRWLLDDLKVDCLGLGEITNSDLTFLKECSSNKMLASFDGTLKEGRLQFDTGAIYDAQRLAINNVKSIVISHGGQNSKLTNRIDFVSALDSSLVHVFISHWPSRINTEENIKRRKTLAIRLKEEIRSIHEKFPDAGVILMGDFNDEPFDESMCYHLLATRDRLLAKTQKDFLYNPFWRQIGESEPYAHSDTKNGSAGSCFYKSGFETRWRTFDQILFSSTFLGGGNWHLNEQKTMILRTDFLLELVQSCEVHFDHLPVLSVIERKRKEI